MTEERDGGIFIRLLAEPFGRERREQLLAEICAGYEELRSDPVAWQEELREREAWDVTLLDGLQEEPPWLEIDGEAGGQRR